MRHPKAENEPHSNIGHYFRTICEIFDIKAKTIGDSETGIVRENTGGEKLDLMTKMAPRAQTDFEQIPFRMHPRVFAALGADLVTNDVVAVIELVKNSYDAFAENVWLRFRENPSFGKYLEIKDDGNGMTKEVVENVWCLVATPYKGRNPVVKSGNKERRVAGEKGLGRLSVARLGAHLHMLTKAPRAPCWEVKVNWSRYFARR